MASNANFISQFVMGGDPCTYKESGELQAEMSKLTHPARPDVDWRRVEKLSLALFRQNGVELQTQVCYVLAITRRQGLAGMAARTRRISPPGNDPHRFRPVRIDS